jgi:hypothetical protein
LRMPPSASTRKQDCASFWLLYFMRCRVRGMLRIETMLSAQRRTYGAVPAPSG